MTNQTIQPSVEFDPPLLHVIARRISDHFATKYSDAKRFPAFVAHARPYLDAMRTLDTCHDHYGFDSGESIVCYALSNLASWRGEFARHTKSQLREHLARYAETQRSPF